MVNSSSTQPSPPRGGMVFGTEATLDAKALHIHFPLALHLYSVRRIYARVADSLQGGEMAETVAKLALEDGTVFTGRSFGSEGETFGEVVFNTSMTGYQEVLTDPSYKGQIVCMTYPHIGNYGITAEDTESQKPPLEGFIVR